MAKRSDRQKRIKRRLPGRAWKKGDKEPVSGVTGDFTEEGLFFETQYPFSPGSAVKIELAFSGSTIQLDGIVADVANSENHLRAIQVSGMGMEVAYSREQLESLVKAPLPKRRIEIDSAVVIYFGSDSRELKLRNLSASGAALISESSLPDISFVRMIFRLKDSSYPIEINGIPVRSEDTEDGILIGMRFLDPPDRVIEEIEEFVRSQVESSTEEHNKE